MCVQTHDLNKKKQLLRFSVSANGEIMKPEEWEHKVPWVCVEVSGSQLSSITLLLLWRTRRSSASSTFLLILLLDATPRRGCCFTLSWCAELMDTLEKASGQPWPQNTNVSFPAHVYQNSLQLHDGRFSVFAPLVLQEQFQDWRKRRKGRFMINRTKQAGRPTVHEPSSSCEQSEKNQTLLWSKKTFVCPHHACGPSLHTCFLLRGFKTMPFFILSIISWTAFALMLGADG